MIDFLHFCLNLILAGFIFRFLELKTAGTPIGNALAYLY